MFTTIAIAGLVLWMMALLVLMAGLRTVVSASGAKQANEFAPTGEDVGPFSQRLCRVHANSYEFVPFALAILVYDAAVNTAAITNDWALWLLGARVAQSLIHLVSTSVPAVMLRFLALLVQVVLVVWWSVQILMSAL